MKRVLYIALIAVIVLVIAGAAALQSVAVDTWLFKQFVSRGIGGPDAKLAEADELSVLLVGTGTPLPDKSRAGPSTMIAAGSHLYLVDAGVDAARNLQLWKVPMDKIEAILITHLHSDHIGGLAEIRLQSWVAGRKTPLKVYGPPGIERVVSGFNEAYAIDDSYRVKHHGAAMLPPAAAPLEAVVVAMPNGKNAPVFNVNGLKVTAVRVTHHPADPAYGYRFDYVGRSVTVSGDTSYDENLARGAMNSDVLVHEGLQPEMVGIMEHAMLDAGRPRPAKIMHDIPAYHTAPVDAAKIANLAHARLLLFTHILPIVPDNAVFIRVFLKGVEDVRPDGVKVGHDGTIVRLKKGDTEVQVSDL